MNWLFEQQIPTIVISIGVAALAIGAFLRSRRPVFLLGLALAAALLGIGLWIEAAVVTENEQIENSLLAVADAMENGDLDTVLSYIDTSETSFDAIKLRSLATAFMLANEFESVTVNVQRVDITRSSSPIRARVRIFGKATISSASGENQQANRQARNGPVMGRLVLWMHKDEDRWIIEKHEEFNE